MRKALSWLAFGMATVLGSSGQAQVTRRVSLGAGGAQGNRPSSLASITPNGHFVAFYSTAPNLVPADGNGVGDIFVRNRLTGSTEIVSVDSNEVPGNAGPDTLPPAISADDHFVAFASLASNLVPGDTNGTWDVFVRNRLSGTTQRVSVSSAGVQGNDQSYYASISADGRYVAFGSEATNLVPGDTNAVMDIFVRDLLNGVTERVSRGDGSAGLQVNGRSTSPAISSDGQYVAFASLATDLVAMDTNLSQDIFVRDRVNHHVRRVSMANGGTLHANGHSDYPSISADGLHVAFLSIAPNLVAGDSNGTWDVFVAHWQGTLTEMASRSSSGAVADGPSNWCSISADGTAVAFDSNATNLVAGDTNGVSDIFVRRILDNTTVRASVASNGTQADAASERPSVSGDGRFITFASDATNLVPGDTNGFSDVFLRDLDPAAFTSLCHPGVSPVIVCPCSNPGASGRGCDNSVGTTGAILTASGNAYLSSDRLVFATFGEKPTALSIVLQGTAYVSTGVVYGQGVRCVGGTLKRLYTKTASSGSITAPDFGAGNPSVSARSAALGNPIQGGQSRWYLVYYRDGVVLGGCPATSTFTTTQTGRVDWSQ